MNITHTDIRKKSRELLDALSQNLYEREEAVKLALLTAIAGESMFLLGHPGVGKSLVARRLKHAFLDGTSFEYLMNKFSTPDEVFGPVSIKKLKEEDKYERLTDRYLPGANIVFLDEIWKAGPAIQNALLTIINEKIYRNGESDIQVDIKGIITASNELPPRDHSLDPLWDRFLIRYEVIGIKENRNFLDMITGTQDVYADNVSPALKISTQELEEWSQAINQVEVPAEVQNTLQLVRHKLEAYNAKPNTSDPIRIFDRRWKKVVRLLRTSAFLNGRSKVDLMDCFLMIHCLWSKPEQIELIQEIVGETIRKHGYSIALNLNILRKEIEEFEQEVEQETRIKRSIAEDRLLPVKEAYYELLDQGKSFEAKYLKIEEFQTLGQEEGGKVINLFDGELNLLRRLKARLSQKENAVDISFNSIEYTIGLRTKKAERVEIMYKKPHPLVEKHWEERVANLNNYLLERQNLLTEEQPEELAGLEQNLFVDARLSPLVRANLDEVSQALNQFKLRLDKLQHAYLSL